MRHLIRSLRASTRRDRAVWRAALGVVVLGASSSSAQDFGYAVSQGHLLRVELNTAAVEIIGETGLDRPVGALTFAPDGRLYGVSSVADVYSLLAIDPRNGDTTVIGPLGVTPFGLAADGAGRLWLSVDSSLYRVDPGTGAAALVADLGRPLWSLAALGTRLFVVTADGSQRLEEIDLETNQLTPLFELDTPIIFDAGFDAGGTLWLVGMGGGITINVPLYYFKVPDLDAGVLVETFQHTYHFTELEAGMLNLALPVVAPTDVPVLDVLGLSLLAALLGLLGFRRLCVQRGGGHPRRPSTLQRPARAEFKMISSRRSAASRSSSQRAPGGKGQPENRS